MLILSNRLMRIRTSQVTHVPVYASAGRSTINVPVAASCKDVVMSLDNGCILSSLFPHSELSLSNVVEYRVLTSTVTADVKSRVRVHCDMVAAKVDWRNHLFIRSQSLRLQQGCQNAAKSHLCWTPLMIG